MKKFFKKSGLLLGWLGICFVTMKFETGDLSYMLVGLIGAFVIGTILEL